MKRILAIALLACAATPAAATGGYVCTTEGSAPIEVAIVTGHGVAPMIAQVRLTEGERTLSTAGDAPGLAILQSWIDEREIRLDLTDPGVRGYEARVRAETTGALEARGTLERGGKTYRLRCAGEQ